MPILQIIRKICCTRNYFPFFHISLCVLLSFFRLPSQPIRVIIREIKLFEKSTRKQGSEKCSFQKFYVTDNNTDWL